MNQRALSNRNSWRSSLLSIYQEKYKKRNETLALPFCSWKKCVKKNIFLFPWHCLFVHGKETLAISPLRRKLEIYKQTMSNLSTNNITIQPCLMGHKKPSYQNNCKTKKKETEWMHILYLCYLHLSHS